MPSSDMNLHRIKSAHNSSTQILNKLGATDTAIRDATTEVMITLEKIPNEMYYLEDATAGGKAYNTEFYTTLDSSRITLVSIGTDKSDGYAERSTLLLILLITLFVIILLCCITACVIAKSRSKHTFFTRSDVECSPECSGINQPLLSLDKLASDTAKTNSTKN